MPGRAAKLGGLECSREKAKVRILLLVVPAIPNQALTPVEEFSRGHKKVQIPREAPNSAHSSPITIFEFNPGLGGADHSPSWRRPLLFAISNNQRAYRGVGCTLDGCPRLRISMQVHTARRG